nr:hypothetical protein [Tanacetum cinerariifolium]
MLESPGRVFQLNGATIRYPDIGLVYLVADTANPQNFNHLRAAWASPETVVCHASSWTPTSRFADIVCATEWIAHLSQRALKERTPGNRALKETAESFERFLSAPETYPLKTPSGKVELFSKTIADFGYQDCGGHPA